MWKKQKLDQNLWKKQKPFHDEALPSKHRYGLRSKVRKQCQQYKIEDQFLRFPHLSEAIFNQLDNETLADCRTINTIWLNFIDRERFIWIRMIENLIGHISKFQDNWKKVLAKTPQKIIKELAVAVQEFYREEIDGETPLHFLAMKGNLESYKFLCKNKEDKNPICRWRTTPLHYAAELGHTEIVKYILDNISDKLPKSKAGSGGWTPLHCAARWGQFKTFEIIADYVEDKNPADGNGETPLFVAAALGYFDICKYILTKVKEKNPKNLQGNTPLHCAAQRGHIEIFKIIAETLENKNPAKPDGRTALHLAVEEGHFDVCSYIIDNTKLKNPPIITGLGLRPELGSMTPLHIAAQNGNLKIYHLIAKHLKEKNPPDNNGFTALHFAVHGRNFDVCKYILQKIEDKHPENVFRQTPLQAAMKNKYSLVVKLYEQVDKKVYKKMSDTYNIPNRGKGSYENLEWRNSF